MALLGSIVVPSIGVDAAEEADWEVIADGLNNPRGIDVFSAATVYVAEAGTGGDSEFCKPDPEGGPDKCLGLTGSITRIRGGVQERIVEGLPSFAGPSGGGADGPSDVEWFKNRLYLTTALGADPAVRDGLGPDAQNMGSLLMFRRFRGTIRQVGDIAAHEAAENPDGAQVDSNPNSLAIRRQKFYVADAGGNSVVEVDSRGRTSTAAVFPATLVDAPPFLGLPDGAQIPMDAVPTSVTKGPDGALYVGQLTGFPFPVGAAKVYRVIPGQEPTVFAEGFTNIMDLAFGPNGELYVLEIAANSLLGPPGGAIWMVTDDGGRELILAEPLFFPGGIAVSRNGDIFVTNCGVCAGGGEVIRINR